MLCNYDVIDCMVSLVTHIQSIRPFYTLPLYFYFDVTLPYHASFNRGGSWLSAGYCRR